MLSERLKSELQRSDESLYRIGKNIGTAEIVLSRFVRGERGLSMENIDKLASYLGLTLVSIADAPAKKTAKRKPVKKKAAKAKRSK